MLASQFSSRMANDTDCSLLNGSQVLFSVALKQSKKDSLAVVSPGDRGTNYSNIPTLWISKSNDVLIYKLIQDKDVFPQLN